MTEQTASIAITLLLRFGPINLLLFLLQSSVYINVFLTFCYDIYLLSQGYGWYRARERRVREGLEDDEQARLGEVAAYHVEQPPSVAYSDLDDLLYAYRPLQSNRDIRLLALQGGAKTDPICCSFDEVELGPSGITASGREFEAISYRWDNSKCLIRCEDKFISVSHTVRDLLVRLRHSDRSRMIWIDALCINQGDPSEKALQIPLMGQIYTCCTQCIIWLGRDGQDDVLAFKLLAKLQRVVRKGTISPAAGPGDLDTLASLRAFEAPRREDITTFRQWEALRFLLGNPWFERIWTFQEAVLPNDLLIMRGRFEISGESFYDAISLIDNTHLRQYLQERPGIKKEKGLSREERAGKWLVRDLGSEGALVFGYVQALKVADMRHRLHSKYERFGTTPDPALFDLLRAARERDTSDLRDKVSGVMGLFSSIDSSSSSSVNINLHRPRTAEEVYTAVANYLLQSKDPLRLLFAVAHLPSNRVGQGLDLPSWIPNWATRISLTSRMGLFERTTHFYAGGRNPRPRALLTKGSQTFQGLRLKGKIVSPLRNIIEPHADGLYDLYKHHVKADKAAVRGYRLVPWEPFDWVSFHGPIPTVGQLFDWLKAVIRRDGQRHSLAIDSDLYSLFLTVCWKEILSVHEDEAVAMALLQQVLTCEATEGPRRQQIFTNMPPLYKPGRRYWNLCLANPLFWNDQTAKFHEDLEAWTWERSFCVTENGLVGWVPVFAEPGDEICVLDGCSLPFVLRRQKGDTFTVIGHCYIARIMHGEVMADHGIPLQDICLV